MIADGRQRTGRTLEQFYGQREILEQVARLGVALPPCTNVNENAPPAYAEVNPLDPFEAVSRWIAVCPDCPGGSSYVWVAGPHVMFCLACANQHIGHQWRRVVVPADRLEIERLLNVRPLSSQRVWTAAETLDDLRAENLSLGLEVS